MYRQRSLRLLQVAGVALSAGMVPPRLAPVHVRPRHCSQADAGQTTATSVATYPANDPTEDRHVLLGGGTGGWRAAAVLDGHGGWQCAQFAADNLVSAAQTSIKDCASSQCIEKRLREAFLSAEADFLDLIRPSYQQGHGKLSSVGSCVVLALVRDKTLVVSSLGDCRAVLAHEGADSKEGSLRAVTLTRDHNARVPLERLLLEQSHPNEPNIVVCKSPTACYVKGRLQLTRALGDAYLKYPEFNAPASEPRSSGRHIPAPYTPPYVGTEPDTTVLALSPGDKFLILASDGLWDYLSDQQAVDAVRVCLASGVPRDLVAAVLVDMALGVAAAESRMSLEQLKALPVGRDRRRRHDDTTAVVLFL